MKDHVIHTLAVTKLFEQSKLHACEGRESGENQHSQAKCPVSMEFWLLF
jgi:hypothetical protein